MSLEEWRIIFFSTGFFVILIIIAPLALGFFPSNEEQFTSMAVLGENMTEGKYFPNVIANITSEQIMKWNIILYNHMDVTQYMMVKVKVLNSTMSTPNNILMTHSTESSVYEIERILIKNETAIIPFQWRISNASPVSDKQFIINKMIFNGHTLDVTQNRIKGEKFRLVFELWLYDTDSMAFKFDVGPQEAQRIVWNQIWFDFWIKQD
jgi:hypothetical protein